MLISAWAILFILKPWKAFQKMSKNKIFLCKITLKTQLLLSFEPLLISSNFWDRIVVNPLYKMFWAFLNTQTRQFLKGNVTTRNTQRSIRPIRLCFLIATSILCKNMTFQKHTLSINSGRLIKHCCNFIPYVCVLKL